MNVCIVIHSLCNFYSGSSVLTTVSLLICVSFALHCTSSVRPQSSCVLYERCLHIMKNLSPPTLTPLALSLSLSFTPSLFLSLSHSGRTRLEICGSGVGQDFPVGLPHSVNTGNGPHLHPCSADVPQHTFMNTLLLT